MSDLNALLARLKGMDDHDFAAFLYYMARTDTETVAQRLDQWQHPAGDDAPEGNEWNFTDATRAELDRQARWAETAPPSTRTLPGHPVASAVGHDCCCGGCLALPARRTALLP